MTIWFSRNKDQSGNRVDPIIQDENCLVCFLLEVTKNFLKILHKNGQKVVKSPKKSRKLLGTLMLGSDCNIFLQFLSLISAFFREDNKCMIIVSALITSSEGYLVPFWRRLSSQNAPQILLSESNS